MTKFKLLALSVLRHSLRWGNVILRSVSDEGSRLQSRSFASLRMTVPAMSDRLLLFFLCLLLLTSSSNVWAQDESQVSSVTEVKGLTLEDCYALALKQSEQIGILQQKIQEVEGQYVQAIGSVVPKTAFLLTEFRQDSGAVTDTGSSVGGTLNRASRPERKFTFEQPLFRGFKTFAALGGASALKKQRILEVERGRQLLFLDVVDAFYGLLQPRDEVASLESIRELSEKRIVELQARVDLGRSRASEIANAQAQLKTIVAQIQQTRRFEIASINVLRFLTGRLELGELIDAPESPVASEDLNAYLAKVANRPDVMAARKAVEVAKQNVAYARADFFPKLSLDGNLYTKRVGFQADTQWDLLLTFDVPLFEGVRVWGAVHEAEAKQREAELDLSRVQRLAETEIRSAFTELKLSLAASDAFLDAEKASLENYHMQNKEYFLNLVNNLDVLNALESLESVRRDLLISRYQAKRDWARLKVATGDLR